MSRLVLTPRWAAATASRLPGCPCPQPCGSETTPGMRSSLISTGTRRLPTREEISARAPASMLRWAASSGCICKVHRFRPATRLSTLCIHELFDRKCRRPISRRPSGWLSSRRPSIRSNSEKIGSAASSIRAEGVASRSGIRGSSAPRSMPWGLSSSSRRESPSFASSKPSP